MVNVKQQFTDKYFRVIMHAGVVNNGRRSITPPKGGVAMGLYEFLAFVFLVTICIVAIKA